MNGVGKKGWEFFWISREQPIVENRLQREIEAADRQIDQFYELYGLTEEEIKIVEEVTAK